MAKNTLPGLNKALKAVNAMGRQMTREADADYSVALSALRAGNASLSKQTRGLTRDMLSGQVKANASLSKLARNARAQKRVVQNQQNKTTRMYGSALGQSIASSYRVAGAVAAGTGAKVTGAAKASKATTSVASTVAGIASAGVAAQKAAAKYSLNQALQQRAIIDNQTLAGLTGQLYNTALSYNMQMAMYEKQRADAMADAKKAEVGETKETVEWLTSNSGEMGAWLQHADEMDTYVKDDGTFDLTAAITAYKDELGLDPAVNPRDADQIALMTIAMRGIGQGMDAETAINGAMDELFQNKAGWERLSTDLKGSTSAYMQASVDARAATVFQDISSVSYDPGDVSGLPIDLGDIYWGDRDATASQMKEATAYGLKRDYGESVARSWLRSSGMADDAIDWYLANIPEADYQSVSFGTVSQPTTNPNVAPATGQPYAGAGGVVGFG